MSAVIRTPKGRQLDATEARTITDDIRRDTHALWALLLRAFEGGAHLALGYANWHDYCRDEFQVGRSHAYRLIDAARVVDVIEAHSPMGERTITTERVARELTPLLDDVEALKEAHAEVVSTAPQNKDGKPEITARQVKAVVEKRRPQPPNPVTPPSTANAASRELPPPPKDLVKLVRDLRNALQNEPDAALGALKELEAEACTRPL